MADKYSQTLSFKADLSQLVAELQRMPDTAGKEAKTMVANLSREFKKAEKEAAKAGAAAAKAAKAARGPMKAATESVQGLGGSFKNLGESTGQADTQLKAIGGAIGLISPEAERAFIAMGDLAGGVEGGIKSMLKSLGPMVAVTAAVAAGAFAWDHYTKELEEAEEATRKAAQATADMQRMVAGIKTAQATAELQKLVNEGKAHRSELLALNVEQQTASKFQGLLTKRRAEQNKVQVKYNQALAEEKQIMSAMRSGAQGQLAAFEAAKKARTDAAGQLKLAKRNTEAVEDAQNKLASTLFENAQFTSNNTQATKRNTQATKASADEIEKLISATDRMLPKEQIGKVQELTRQLETLQATAQLSAENAGRLAPSIAAVGEAIDTLQAEQAAQEVASLVEEANKLAPPATLSRMQQLVNLQGQLSQAMQSGAGDAGATSDAHARATTAIADEWAALEQSLTSAAQSAANSMAGAAQAMGDHWKEVLRRITNLVQTSFSNAAQAASNFAQIGLDNAMKYGEDELEIRGENIAELEAQLQEAMNARADIEREASGITAEQERAQTAGRVEEIRKRLAEEKRAQGIMEAEKNAAIVKAFNIQQTARSAEAVMNTAAAVMLAATFVPPPLNAPLIASMVALGASQVALIASQEPPTMHTGGMIGPDEAMIKARRGEGVLTQQGVAAIGGPAGLDAANRGQGSGGQVIQMVYKHKVLDEVVSDSIRRGGPIQKAINKRSPRGRRNPHGRRTG